MAHTTFALVCPLGIMMQQWVANPVYFGLLLRMEVIIFWIYRFKWQVVRISKKLQSAQWLCTIEKSQELSLRSTWVSGRYRKDTLAHLSIPDRSGALKGQLTHSFWYHPKRTLGRKCLLPATQLSYNSIDNNSEVITNTVPVITIYRNYSNVYTFYMYWLIYSVSKALWDRYYCSSPSTDEETEAQRVT